MIKFDGSKLKAGTHVVVAPLPLAGWRFVDEVTAVDRKGNITLACGKRFDARGRELGECPQHYLETASQKAREEIYRDRIAQEIEVFARRRNAAGPNGWKDISSAYLAVIANALRYDDIVPPVPTAAAQLRRLSRKLEERRDKLRPKAAK